MKHSTPTMRAIAEHLITYEAIRNKQPSTNGPAAFGGAVEKLRRPLVELAGVAGFRSLLVRSLALAVAEARWLRGVQVKPDGSLQVPTDMKQLDQEEIDRGQVALLAQLLGLLATFIGETLTSRLVEDMWPAAGIDKLVLKEEKQ